MLNCFWVSRSALPGNRFSLQAAKFSPNRPADWLQSALSGFSSGPITMALRRTISTDGLLAPLVLALALLSCGGSSAFKRGLEYEKLKNYEAALQSYERSPERRPRQRQVPPLFRPGPLPGGHGPFRPGPALQGRGSPGGSPAGVPPGRADRSLHRGGPPGSRDGGFADPRAGERDGARGAGPARRRSIPFPAIPAWDQALGRGSESLPDPGKGRRHQRHFRPRLQPQPAGGRARFHRRDPHRGPGAAGPAKQDLLVGPQGKHHSGGRGHPADPPALPGRDREDLPPVQRGRPEGPGPDRHRPALAAAHEQGGPDRFPERHRGARYPRQDRSRRADHPLHRQVQAGGHDRGVHPGSGGHRPGSSWA